MCLHVILLDIRSWIKIHNLEQHKTDGQFTRFTHFIHPHLLNIIPNCWHSCLIFESPRLQIQARRQATDTEILRGFQQSLKLHYGRFLPHFSLFVTHRKLLNVSFDTNFIWRTERKASYSFYLTGVRGHTNTSSQPSDVQKCTYVYWISEKYI